MKTFGSEHRHGVMMKVGELGVFIIGPANIGKSSLALELLHQGHQLIADDSVEFRWQANKLTAHCPSLLSGLLHSRELGLINITHVFGQHAVLTHYPVDYVVELSTDIEPVVALVKPTHYYAIGDSLVPKLILNTQSPASLSNRLTTWLAMQDHQQDTEKLMQQRQQQQMNSQ